MSEPSAQPELLLSPERDNDPLIGRVIDNRYRILSLIAIGGMGRVYRAEQTSLGRVVALKVLAIPRDTAAMDPQFRERFALEAATASRLANPNTVTIFDYGRTEDDLYYLVMEFVEGITLSRLLKTEKRLVTERALQIARQICHSLVEAHARGIIHRDIKPANILLLLPDLEWVKVLDFGIARFMNDQSSTDTDEQLTRVGTYVGTPEYMAPESFYSRVDARADIYSIGVMLYLMLTGRVPLQGATHTATIVMAVHDEVPRIDPALGVPPFVESLMMRCLAKKPEDRYQSMAELLNAIASCLVEMGAALHAPTHPTVTGTGVKPTLELTLRPNKADGELPALPGAGQGRTKWLVAGGVGVAAALAIGYFLWSGPGLSPPVALPSAASSPATGAAPGGPTVAPPALQPAPTGANIAGPAGAGAITNGTSPTGASPTGASPNAIAPSTAVPTTAVPSPTAASIKSPTASPSDLLASEALSSSSPRFSQVVSSEDAKKKEDKPKAAKPVEEKSSTRRKRETSSAPAPSAPKPVAAPVVPEGYKPSPY